MIEIAQTYHFWNVGVCSKLFPGWFRIVSRVTEINNTCCVLFCYPFGPDWMYTLNFLKSRAPTKCWLLKCCYNFFLYTYTYIFSKQKSHKRNITQLAPSERKMSMLMDWTCNSEKTEQNLMNTCAHRKTLLIFQGVAQWLHMHQKINEFDMRLTVFMIFLHSIEL